MTLPALVEATVEAVLGASLYMEPSELNRFSIGVVAAGISDEDTFVDGFSLFIDNVLEEGFKFTIWFV